MCRLQVCVRWWRGAAAPGGSDSTVCGLVCGGSSEAAHGSDGHGTSGSATQRTQQECMQQAAFQLSPAAQQLLLRGATAGLHGFRVLGF